MRIADKGIITINGNINNPSIGAGIGYYQDMLLRYSSTLQLLAAIELSLTHHEATPFEHTAPNAKPAKAHADEPEIGHSRPPAVQTNKPT